MKSLASSAILALLLLNGCDVHYTGQEVQLRYNPADDSLDFLILYKGVMASQDNEKTVASAASLVQRLAEGRRMFDTPWVQLDLDDPELYKEQDPEVIEVLSGVALLDWDLFLDEEKRLCGFQHFRLADCGRTFACLNRQISRWVLEAAAAEDFVKDTPLLDDRSRDLLCQRATSGAPWLHFVGGEFWFDLPMTWASWNRLQHKLISEVAPATKDRASSLLLQHLVHLRHLEIENERVVLGFGAPATGIYQFALEDENVKYNPQLKDALKAAGVRLESDTTLESARRKLGLQKE